MQRSIKESEEDFTAKSAKEDLGLKAKRGERGERGEFDCMALYQKGLAAEKISLNLKNMPAKAVLKYLTDQTGAKVRYDEHAVVISPR